MAGSLPRLPQRLRVRGETRRISATSRTVSRSGRFMRSRFFLRRGLVDLVVIVSVCVICLPFDYQ